jgi:ribosome-binding factor A
MYFDDEPRAKPDRRTQRLCGEVARVLGFALSWECEDDMLSSLEVLSVEPAPDAGRLRVTVRPGAGVDPKEALARLRGATRFLRQKVAERIQRRRAPELVFEIRPEEDDA